MAHARSHLGQRNRLKHHMDYRRSRLLSRNSHSQVIGEKARDELPEEVPGGAVAELPAKEAEPNEEKTVKLPVALRRIHDKLRAPAELYKLHPKQFKKRTSALQIPKDIYEAHVELVKECDACPSTFASPR